MAETRRMPQLRIAVNARCDRACLYCRPSGEAVPTSASEELTAETVNVVCQAAVALGIREVKLTGGDPALWSPLVDCVTRLKRDSGVIHLQVITRHPRIGGLATSLASAGVDLINISLDTLDPKVHRGITSKGDLAQLLAAIEQCIATGVPCTLNTVVMKDINRKEINDLIGYCERTGISSLKLLDVIQDLDKGSETHGMRLAHFGKRTLRELYVPLDDIVEELRPRSVSVRTLYQGGLGHPMTAMHLSTGLEVVVKDHRKGAWYGPMCHGCCHYPCHDALMALRLTPDARLQFCLLREDLTIDLNPYIKAGSRAIQTALEQALQVYESATFNSGSPKTNIVVQRERPLVVQQLPVLPTTGCKS